MGTTEAGNEATGMTHKRFGMTPTREDVREIREAITAQRDFLLVNTWVQASPPGSALPQVPGTGCLLMRFDETGHRNGVNLTANNGLAKRVLSRAASRLGWPFSARLPILNDIQFCSGGDAIAVLEEAFVVLKEIEEDA